MWNGWLLTEIESWLFPSRFYGRTYDARFLAAAPRVVTRRSADASCR